MDQRKQDNTKTRTSQTPPTAGTERDVTRLPWPSDTVRMLVVDDSFVFSERLATLVRRIRLPVRLVTANCGSDARCVFAEYCPDLVVLEIQLPDTSGFDLLAQFKRQRPECVVIIFTAHAYPQFQAHALRLGADFFFSKATDLESIGGVVAATARERGPARPASERSVAG